MFISLYLLARARWRVHASAPEDARFVNPTKVVPAFMHLFVPSGCTLLVRKQHRRVTVLPGVGPDMTTLSDEFMGLRMWTPASGPCTGRPRKKFLGDERRGQSLGMVRASEEKSEEMKARLGLCIISRTGPGTFDWAIPDNPGKNQSNADICGRNRISVIICNAHTRAHACVKFYWPNPKRSTLLTPTTPLTLRKICWTNDNHKNRFTES